MKSTGEVTRSPLPKKSDLMIHLPYFWSAQLDGTKDSTEPGYKWARREGWFGLIFFNAFVWITVVTLDAHLLTFEFNDIDSHVHMLQTGSLTAVATSAATMLLFTMVHYCSPDRPFSSLDGDGEAARILPPFVTALITGGLRATLGFTYLILLTAGAAFSHDSEAFKILVALIALKHFGIAMALANQRLAVFTELSVVSATN